QRWEEVLGSVVRREPKPKKPGPYSSIIIPVFNRCELTEKCLVAVFRNTQEHFEVLVVDNASSDGTSELLDRWKGQIRTVRNTTNLGFAAANNQAAELAVGDRLVMLNNDTEVRPGWLEALLRCQAETGAWLVGSRLYYPDGSIQHAGVAFYPHDKKPHALYAGLPSHHGDFEFLTGRRREFQCVTAACWLVTEKAWKETGGFDEGFINGYEDVDFCLRLVEKGGRIFYEPASQITHHESQSPGRGRHSAVNEQRLFERWRSRWIEDLPFYLADDRLVFDPTTGYKPSGGPFEANIRALSTMNPGLADTILQLRGGFARRRLEYVPEGPSLRIRHKGSAVLLNSIRDPRREADKLAEQAVAKQGLEEVRLFGFGLGFLAESLLARLGPSARLVIRLEDPLVFRVALENRDLSGLLLDPRLTFDNQIEPSGAFWLPALLQLRA
ncbi:MAG: glycosyltransferase, partial [Planctomycetota bacterium]